MRRAVQGPVFGVADPNQAQNPLNQMLKLSTKEALCEEALCAEAFYEEALHNEA